MRDKPRVFSRAGEVERRRRIMEKLHSPRLQMGFIAALTGASGLLASYLLRLGGLSSMALRYPLAVAIAYVAFLFFLWCWLRWGDIGPNEIEGGSDLADLGYEIAGESSGSTLYEPTASASRISGGGDSDGGSFDVDIGDGEGAIIGLVIVAVVALFTAVFAAFSLITMAPVLFAELLVDAALAGGLYRHVRGIDRERNWLTTAVSRTIWRFAGVAALAAAVGWLVAWFVPGADSIGALLH